MGLRLQRRAAVERALGESRRLGREAFLEQYGFGPSRQYLLVVDRIEYDSKAVAGVAHGFDHPDEGPLPASALSGGVRGAAGALRALGFEVTGEGEQPARTAVAPRDVPAVPVSAQPDLVAGRLRRTQGDREAPAEDLYVSPLFRSVARTPSAPVSKGLILSALHGLV